MSSHLALDSVPLQGEKVEEPPRNRQQGKERENRKLLEQSLSKMSASNRNTLAVKKLREAVKTGVLGASFLLTGTETSSMVDRSALNADATPRDVLWPVFEQCVLFVAQGICVRYLDNTCTTLSG